MEPIKAKITLLERYSQFEMNHQNDFNNVHSLINDVQSGLIELGDPKNFQGGISGFRNINLSEKDWYKNLKQFNDSSEKERIEVVAKIDENGKLYYEVYKNGKIDQKLTDNFKENMDNGIIALPDGSYLEMVLDNLETVLHYVGKTLEIVGGGTAVVAGILGSIGGATVVTLVSGGTAIIVDGVIVAVGVTVTVGGGTILVDGIQGLQNGPTINFSEDMLGSNGPKISSKTTWQNGKTERIDVENPNPGNGPGNIHYHEPNNTKWKYDPKTGVFRDPDSSILAPPRIQKLLKNKKIIDAIKKALHYLGE